MNTYYYIIIITAYIFVLLLLFLLWWSSFIPSRNLDEVFTHNHLYIDLII